MLFAALAPSISHAMSAARGEAWAEVCTVAGIKFVKASTAQDGAADPVKQQTLHLEHCPFCSIHAGSFALLPPSAGITVPSLELPDTHPFLFFQAPHPLAIWTSAQSRAPPVQA